MNRKTLLTLGLISLFVMFVTIGVLSLIAHEGTTSLEKNLNEILNSRDTSQIARLSETRETKEFLLNLPVNIKATRTTSSQGASIITTEKGVTIEKVYFLTTLNGKTIEVYMYEDKRSKFFYKLFPKWTISSLRA